MMMSKLKLCGRSSVAPETTMNGGESGKNCELKKWIHQLCDDDISFHRDLFLIQFILLLEQTLRFDNGKNMIEICI